MISIKDFLVYGNLIYIRDYSDAVELCAIGADATQTEWLANSLSIFHGAPVTTLSSAPSILLTDK